jgi:hypothetical protein
MNICDMVVAFNKKIRKFGIRTPLRSTERSGMLEEDECKPATDHRAKLIGLVTFLLPYWMCDTYLFVVIRALRIQVSATNIKKSLASRADTWMCSYLLGFAETPNGSMFMRVCKLKLNAVILAISPQS